MFQDSSWSVILKTQVWDILTDNGCDRYSILVSFTDVCTFLVKSSIFFRGLRKFFNILIMDPLGWSWNSFKLHFIEFKVWGETEIVSLFSWDGFLMGSLELCTEGEGISWCKAWDISWISVSLGENPGTLRVLKSFGRTSYLWREILLGGA